MAKGTHTNYSCFKRVPEEKGLPHSQHHSTTKITVQPGLNELCTPFYTGHTGGVVKILRWREKWEGQPYKMVCLSDIISVIGQRYRNNLLLVEGRKGEGF